MNCGGTVIISALALSLVKLKTSLTLAHKIFTFLFFLNILLASIIIGSGSIPVSAILPQKIDIIVGVL